MSLRQQLPTMMKDAMKARDQVRLDTIRFIMAQAKNAEIDLKREMTDEELMTLLKREVKNRAEAIEQFKTGGREDIVAEEEAKLAVIKEMLPAEMSDDELDAVVQKVAAEATDKSFGLVMKSVMAQVKGQADGKRVSEAVKKALG